MNGGGREAVVVADSSVCASVRACVYALCHGNCGGLVAAVVAFDFIDRRESFCRRMISMVKHRVEIEDSNNLVVVLTIQSSYVIWSLLNG